MHGYMAWKHGSMEMDEFGNILMAPSSSSSFSPPPHQFKCMKFGQESQDTEGRGGEQRGGERNRHLKYSLCMYKYLFGFDWIFKL